MINKYKLLVFGAGVLLIEAVVLTFMLIMFVSVMDVFSLDVDAGLKNTYRYTVIDWIYTSVVFFLFKCILELWLFLLVVCMCPNTVKPKMKYLFIGKAVSSLFMIGFLFRINDNTLDMLTLLYIPSVILAYMIFSKWWSKGLVWITKSE